MEYEMRHIFPFIVAIVAIVAGWGVAMLWVWTEHRRKREMFLLLHKERLLAIERGQEIPPLPAEFFRGAREREAAPGTDLRSGLILLLMGVALMFALAFTQSMASSTWGLVLVAMGAAMLINYTVTRRQQASAPAGESGGHLT